MLARPLLACALHVQRGAMHQATGCRLASPVQLVDTSSPRGPLCALYVLLGLTVTGRGMSAQLSAQVAFQGPIPLDLAKTFRQRAPTAPRGRIPQPLQPNPLLHA